MNMHMSAGAQARGVGSPIAGVIGGCEQPDMVLGTVQVL